MKKCIFCFIWNAEKYCKHKSFEYMKKGEISDFETRFYLIIPRCDYNYNKQNNCKFYKTQQKPSRYISKGDRYEVLKRQYWKCNICNKHLKYSENHSYGDEVAHIDHIHPFTEWATYDGYINELSNLQALCPGCNMHKHKNNIN